MAIFYDIETQYMSTDFQTSTDDGWSDITRFLFGSAVTYNTKTDLYEFWDKDQKQELIDYLTGNVVISFNGIYFDSTVLLGNGWKEKEHPWYNFDIKEEITKQVFNVSSTEEALLTYDPRKIHGGYSLNGICQKTLKIGKNEDTVIIPQLIREGKWKSVFSYNLQDVRLMKKLLKHITDNQYIINGYGSKKIIKISKKIWSY